MHVQFKQCKCKETKLTVYSSANITGIVNHAPICPFFYNQSNEVGGSNYMEKEGLKRSLDLLRAHSVTFDSIVTDRHPQVQKFLREANITHYYDVWHIEKGMCVEVGFMCWFMT